MSKYIINDFSVWKKVNEQADYKIKGGAGSKAKLFEIDKTSFKIKLVNNSRMLDANGDLTPGGWSIILNEFLLDNIPASKYPALKDLKKNIVIYSTVKDTDRVQTLTFTIKPRTEVPGVPADAQYVKLSELQSKVTDPSKAKALSQTVLSAQQKEGSVLSTPDKTAAPTVTGSFKLDQPISLTDVPRINSEGKVFELLKKLYFVLITNSKLQGNPIFKDVKAELKAKKLGDSTTKMIKGTIAGLGLKDEYGDATEEINQAFIDGVTKLIGTPTAQNASFDYYLGIDGYTIYEQYSGGSSAEIKKIPEVTSSSISDEFIKGFISVVGGETATVSTGDIVVPEGGFKRGVTQAGDKELGKFQQAVIDRFGLTKFVNVPEFAKLKKYGADGKYGNTTEAIVGRLYAGFKVKSFDPKVITKELVSMVKNNKLSESFIFEQFDFDAAAAYAPSTGSTASSGGGKKTTSSDSSSTAASGGDTKSSTSSKTIAKKILVALSGDTESEKDVYDALRLIQSKDQYRGVVNSWNQMKITANNLHRPEDHWNKMKFDEIVKHNEKNTDPLTLFDAIKKYFNSDEIERVNDILKPWDAKVKV